MREWARERCGNKKHGVCGEKKTKEQKPFSKGKAAKKNPQQAMSECPGKESFRPVPRATSRARSSLYIGAARSDNSSSETQGAGLTEAAGAPYIPPAFLSSKGGAPTRGGTVLFHLRRGTPYQKLYVPQGSESTVQARDVRLALQHRLCALKPQFSAQIALFDEVTGTSLSSQTHSTHNETVHRQQHTQTPTQTLRTARRWRRRCGSTRPSAHRSRRTC